MATLLIAQNETVESGTFMGDSLCSLRTAYMFAEHTPNVDRILMSVSPGNQLHFLWTKFIEKYNVELIWDDFDPGNWPQRWAAWDRWRAERHINGIPFDHYRELYLRIHGAQRQRVLCGHEAGLGKRNIYSYWWCGQEGSPDELPSEVDWFDDTLVHHPPHRPVRDVYVSPRAKTQGNVVFTYGFWEDVVRRLVDAGVSVTVGHDGPFCEDLVNHPLYRKHWGDYKEWMHQVCSHKLVSSGNTGTGWLAAACGVPMVTMEPPNSVMPDHRYRECGLRNIVEVVSEPNAEYVARRIEAEVNRKVVLTTGCYDVLHAGHVRHLERARALGTKLIVALNSDASVKALKGSERPIHPQDQRRAVLEALRAVDEVRVFDGPNALPLIEELRPDVLACGYGYVEEDVVGRDMVRGWGGQVVITSRGDAREEPSTTKTIKRMRGAEVAEICRQATAYSVNPYEKLRLMADHFLTVRGLAGDVADLGACRGGTSLILRRLATEKSLHVFDTWAGTPYDDPLCDHKRGEWAASLEDCKRLVGEDDLTYYWQGVFPRGITTDDAPWWDQQEYCFVYVDMDTEQATRDAIEFFWPRVVSGGKIVIDDYGWSPCAGVKKAVDYFLNGCDAYGVEPHTIQSLYAIVLEKR